MSGGTAGFAARQAGTGSDPGLAQLAPVVDRIAEAFVSLSGDIALVLDQHGTIRRVVQNSAAPMAPAAAGWVGRPWIETVTGDTRRKIETLLGDVASTGIGRRREVNHPGNESGGIPVAYTAIRLGEHGPVLAVGRDLRAVAAIQQRFIDHQQELERGYWQARHAESRYRLLFQVATDAVLTLDALSLDIIEANPMAATLFGQAGDLSGAPLTHHFSPGSRGAVNALLTAARSSVRPMEIAARLSHGQLGVGVAATPFRADDTMRLLVRIRTAADHQGASARDTALARLVDAHREGIVVTDASGRLRLANPAFLRLVQLHAEVQLGGQPLSQWIDEAPLQNLIARVRKQGVAEIDLAMLRRADGPALGVGMSAVLLTEGEQECIGITLSTRAATADAAPEAQGWPGMQDVLADLGRRDLPELLARVSAWAERLLIDAALERSTGDAAKAAALLGVPVQRVRRSRRTRGPAPPRP